MIHTVHFKAFPGTGHNIHHDAPNEVAAIIEEFLSGT